MLFVNSANENNLLLIVYMFLYNISLISLFWCILNTISVNTKTLYSLNEFSFNSFTILNLTILLFSMAGVPPFAGFFSKLFIMLLLLNNNFFILYFFFFILIFLGLYFYIQNIKFLYSTNLQTSNLPFFTIERVLPIYLYFTITVLLLLVLGMVYIDDVCLLFTWICS